MELTPRLEHHSIDPSTLYLRLKKSMSEGENLKEAQAINKSLSALGDVISALATEQQVRPRLSLTPLTSSF